MREVVSAREHVIKALGVILKSKPAEDLKKLTGDHQLTIETPMLNRKLLTVAVNEHTRDWTRYLAGDTAPDGSTVNSARKVQLLSTGILLSALLLKPYGMALTKFSPAFLKADTHLLLLPPWLVFLLNEVSALTGTVATPCFLRLRQASQSIMAVGSRHQMLRILGLAGTESLEQTIIRLLREAATATLANFGSLSAAISSALMGFFGRSRISNSLAGMASKEPEKLLPALLPQLIINHRCSAEGHLSAATLQSEDAAALGLLMWRAARGALEQASVSGSPLEDFLDLLSNKMLEHVGLDGSRLAVPCFVHTTRQEAESVQKKMNRAEKVDQRQISTFLIRHLLPWMAEKDGEINWMTATSRASLVTFLTKKVPPLLSDGEFGRMGLKALPTVICASVAERSSEQTLPTIQAPLNVQHLLEGLTRLPKLVKLPRSPTNVGELAPQALSTTIGIVGRVLSGCGDSVETPGSGDEGEDEDPKPPKDEQAPPSKKKPEETPMTPGPKQASKPDPAPAVEELKGGRTRKAEEIDESIGSPSLAGDSSDDERPSKKFAGVRFEAPQESMTDALRREAMEKNLEEAAEALEGPELVTPVEPLTPFGGSSAIPREMPTMPTRPLGGPKAAGSSKEGLMMLPDFSMDDLELAHADALSKVRGEGAAAPELLELEKPEKLDPGAKSKGPKLGSKAPTSKEAPAAPSTKPKERKRRESSPNVERSRRRRLCAKED